MFEARDTAARRAPRSDRKRRWARLMLTAATAFGGATLTESCEMRFRDAFVQGSENYFLSLFNPTTFLDNRPPE